MQKGLSRPKNQIRFLLLEGISPSAVEVLQSAGYDNVEVVAKALDQAALIAALKNVQILGIRSRTQVTEARSEEHTSELQSLMRNSYAVFCLKKKKERTHKTDKT